ncbi:MAG: DUF4185 domain-containing protein [Chthoniobacter sp.]|nr:DUF4185 domain-containing protein [Chthoniobacter sp.]
MSTLETVSAAMEVSSGLPFPSRWFPVAVFDMISSSSVPWNGVFRLIAAVLMVTSDAGAQETGAVEKPVLRYIPGSTVKIEQLLGEIDKERHKPTLSQTFTRFGVLGTDLGYSFEHDGRAYFLFGDTVGHVSWAEDTMAMTEARDPERGVRLNFLMDGKGKYLVIAPPGISMGPFETPAGGISLGGQMYVLVKTDYKDESWSTGRSVITKFVPSGKFEVLRTISKRPGGQFMTMSLHLQPRPYPLLPPGGPYVFIWGTGAYRKSDAFLQIVPAKHFESGEGTRYFAGLNAEGAPIWAGKEAEEQPIVKNGTMGDLSVTWCQALGLWLMTYDAERPSGGVWFRSSRTPWGPWSEPQKIFEEWRDGAMGKFIHNPQAKTPDGFAGPVIGKDRKGWEAEFGGYYAPYVVERFTKVEGSELDLYYCLSTWNPYVVVLMKSRLQIESGASAEPGKAALAPAAKSTMTEKIVPKAMPFPPANVRLFPGPFLDAMEPGFLSAFPEKEFADVAP